MVERTTRYRTAFDVGMPRDQPAADVVPPCRWKVIRAPFRGDVKCLQQARHEGTLRLSRQKSLGGRTSRLRSSPITECSACIGSGLSGTRLAPGTSAWRCPPEGRTTAADRCCVRPMVVSGVSYGSIRCHQLIVPVAAPSHPSDKSASGLAIRLPFATPATVAAMHGAIAATCVLVKRSAGLACPTVVAGRERIDANPQSDGRLYIYERMAQWSVGSPPTGTAVSAPSVPIVQRPRTRPFQG